tara:strand:+ start:79 stop:234 length:156 start_codon:yes stop_codon:yes gene_type:complete
MKKILLFTFLCSAPFFFSCETEDEENGELCEMCDTHCCDQLGTENCCCSGI